MSICLCVWILTPRSTTTLTISSLRIQLSSLIRNTTYKRVITMLRCALSKKTTSCHYEHRGCGIQHVVLKLRTVSVQGHNLHTEGRICLRLCKSQRPELNIYPLVPWAMYVPMTVQLRTLTTIVLVIKGLSAYLATIRTIVVDYCQSNQHPMPIKHSSAKPLALLL